MGSPVIESSAGDAKRAMEALEWAAMRAEGKTAPVDSAIACAADYQAAAAAYLRDMRVHLDRVLMSDDAEGGLDALLEAGALGALLPEVSAMVGFGDGEWRHKDVWKHTKQVVRQAVPRLEIRWAALLHDIGKVRTRSISPDGEVHFFGHAEVGARMFDKMNRRMPIFKHEDSLRTSVHFLILHHLRASQYDASWTDSAVRRFAREMGDSLDDVLCLSRADITTKRPEKKKKGLRQISELADRVRNVLAEDAVVPPLPSGVGDEIMKTYKIPPSRLIGEIKRKLEQAIEAGTLKSHQDSAFYLAHLAANRSEYGLPELPA
jgi:poly(A) polymerase